MLNISFEGKDLYDNDAIAVLIDDQLKLDSETMAIDQKYHGIISKTIADKNKFEGKIGQSVSFAAIDKDGQIKQIIILGTGNESDISEYQIEELGGHIYSKAEHLKARSVGFKVTSRIGNFNEEQTASLLASGALLAAYKFNKYFTQKTEQEKFETKDFNLIVSNKEGAYHEFEPLKALALAVYFARDLVSEVPNILYPESYAQQIMEKLEPLGIDIAVLGEREMRELEMGALLGVGQGSHNESKLVVMRYNGGSSKEKPICFVGKGVTFDTGGISIKPSLNMHDMKHDMAGSAAVIGVLKALALRSAKVNAVGVIGLVENMPGGGAQRPGDVVKTMSGQTAEVLDTDAEGRLVLCDCVTYVQKNFDPDCIIDLATLTGAIVVSLGRTYAGIFANDDGLAQKLTDSSFKTNEKLWRMPLHKDYDDMIKSSVADVANIGSERGSAGSSTAAHFIGRFIKDGVKWAHLDIAGTAWDKTGKNPICPKGGVGFGVRLLNKFVLDHYESK
jgi:leucyl aminopeptidase